MNIDQYEDKATVNLKPNNLWKVHSSSEFEDVYEQAKRIPPRRDCPWLYQLPEEIRRAKDLNNREPLNREPNNLCSYKSSSYVILDLMEKSLRDLGYF